MVNVIDYWWSSDILYMKKMYNNYTGEYIMKELLLCYGKNYGERCYDDIMCTENDLLSMGYKFTQIFLLV